MPKARARGLLRFATFEVDLDAAVIHSRGAKVEVEPQVFELIALLVTNRGRLITYDEILEQVWNGRIVSDAAIATRISGARRVLGDTGSAQRVIKTVRGRGLRFELEPFAAEREAVASGGVSTSGPCRISAASDIELARPELPSIAVLPFENMSSELAQECFADGIVEDIITGLSRVRQLFVIARNSTFTYKGKFVDVRQVARDLGVRYVLEGSVRKAADKVRITSQLIDAETGHQIWADRFDGVLSDVFELQDQVTSSVIGAIQPSIRAAEVDRCRRKRPESLDAYDLYMRALPHVAALDRRSNAAGLELLHASLARDPHFVAALAMAAWCHAQRCVYGWSDDLPSDSGRALELAHKAVHQAGDDSLALSMLGAAHTLVRDFDQAEELLARAVAHDPNCCWGWNRLGWLHGYLERPADSINSFEKALRLSPLDPMNFNCFVGIGAAHYLEARHGIAIHWMEKALTANPNAIWIYRQLVPAYVEAGDDAAAARSIGVLLREYPRLTSKDVRAAMLYSNSIMRRICAGLERAGLPTG